MLSRLIALITVKVLHCVRITSGAWLSRSSLPSLAPSTSVYALNFTLGGQIGPAGLSVTAKQNAPCRVKFRVSRPRHWRERPPRKRRIRAQLRPQSSVRARYLDDAKGSTHVTHAVKGRSSYASLRPASRVSTAFSISPVTVIFPCRDALAPA